MKHKRKTIDRAEAIELAHEAIKEMDFTDITDVVWDLVEGAESINDITCTEEYCDNQDYAEALFIHRFVKIFHDKIHDVYSE